MRHGARAFTLLCSLLAAGARLAGQDAVPTPPPTRQDDVREVMHGVEIVDPYRWLEDQASPETRAWILAQNRYTLAVIDGPSRRAAIKDRLNALSRFDVQGLPIARGGRYFLLKRRVQDDLAILYVRQGLDPADEVLLDPHPLSPDHTTDVSLEDVSADGRVLVYGVRRGGEDETELRVRDVRTHQDLPDLLPRALYRGVSLKADGSGFYYALQDRETGIRVRYHGLGTSTGRDPEVFGGGYPPSAWVGARVSENGRHVLFDVQYGWARDEVFVQDLAADEPTRPVLSGLDAHFQADFAGDQLVVLTDWQAPNGRIVEVDPANPAPSHWREIVPSAPDAIQSFTPAGGKLLVHYLHDVTSRVAVFSLDGKRLGALPLPGPGTVSGIEGRFESGLAFFDFTSYTLPRATYRADLASGAVEPFWRPRVPFDSQAFETRQVWFSSKDGTRVPMFIVHRRGLAIDSRRPTLLYGYGGFNVSITPRFGATVGWWLEQGGVYAVANIRGGAEFGEAWHRGGMLDKKQNVFDDFVAASEWLIANRYTSASRLAIQGVSNGGLLVAAALTQRPDLYRAVLCGFPDLDMVGYYRFPNNNPPALLEYGDASKPEQFPFLYAYSPYQKVTRGTRYPAVLFSTGDADTRVPPLQARKMTARLQAATTSGWPVLLHYDTKAGHAGGRPIGKVVDDESLELAFLAQQLGLEPTR